MKINKRFKNQEVFFATSHCLHITLHRPSPAWGVNQAARGQQGKSRKGRKKKELVHPVIHEFRAAEDGPLVQCSKGHSSYQLSQGLQGRPTCSGCLAYLPALKTSRTNVAKDENNRAGLHPQPHGHGQESSAFSARLLALTDTSGHTCQARACLLHPTLQALEFLLDFQCYFT